MNIRRTLVELRVVPFHKPYIGDDEVNFVVESIRSGWLTMGPKTFELERSFNDYIGTRNAVALNSCTAAMHLSLKVLNVGKNDEVIIPAVNFASAGEVICQEGAQPVLADIEKETGNISVEAVEGAIGKSTRAIMPDHYGGQPCDMEEICGLADENSIAVIEDAAHALPSLYRGRKIGTIGDVGCFSFYATKTMTTGEGGIAITDNDEWAERMKILRLHGISKDAWKRYSDEGDWYYEIVEMGYKYNMTDIQAALGIAQLKRLEWMCEQRKNIADTYIEAFKDIFEIDLIEMQEDRTNSWHLFPILLKLEALHIDRKLFIEKLKKKGIGTSVHFIPLYRHPFYRENFSYTAKEFPNSEWFFEREVSLPIYPSMNEQDLEYVIENVVDICRENRK
jgi:perosamine synthetase